MKRLRFRRLKSAVVDHQDLEVARVYAGAFALIIVSMWIFAGCSDGAPMTNVVLYAAITFAVPWVAFQIGLAHGLRYLAFFVLTCAAMFFATDTLYRWLAERGLQGGYTLRWAEAL